MNSANIASPMDTSPIADVWNRLAGKRLQLVRLFYENLFERYPQYRGLFPNKVIIPNVSQGLEARPATGVVWGS